MDYTEILSRFFDGAPVDAAALTEAFAQPGAIDLLSSFAQLRLAVQAETARPDEEFCDRLRRQVRRSYRARVFATKVVPAALAGTMGLLAAFGVGYRIGTTSSVPTLQLATTPRIEFPSAPQLTAIAKPVAEQPKRKPPPRPAERVQFAAWRERSSDQ